VSPFFLRSFLFFRPISPEPKPSRLQTAEAHNQSGVWY
jgi:hypothetical protein